jgi:hypothetical protein
MDRALLPVQAAGLSAASLSAKTTACEDAHAAIGDGRADGWAALLRSRGRRGLVVEEVRKVGADIVRDDPARNLQQVLGLGDGVVLDERHDRSFTVGQIVAQTS